MSALYDYERVESAGKAQAPIGIFDSGAGGLTILSALRRELPYENYIYFGDTAYCPYGMRSESEIAELSIRANHFLIERGVKLIIVACNTVSLVALNRLKSTFSVPFIGVVPAVKLAVQTTQKGRIGVAATYLAAKSIYLQRLIEEFAEGTQVHSIGCPELVTLVERGELDGPAVEKTVRHAMLPLLEQDVDVIVLGCTHFPALRPVIEHVCGHQVQIIDSTLALVHHVLSVLNAESLNDQVSLDQTTRGKLEVWCSGDSATFSNVASKLLGYPVFANQIQLERVPSEMILG